MTAVEEMQKAGRMILCKHGLADHRISFVIYKERDYNSIESVIRAVCEYYGYTLARIIKRCNKAEFAHPRKVLSYGLYYWAGLNTANAGKLVKRSRVAVYQSRKTMDGYLNNDRALFNELEYIRGLVNKYDEKVDNSVCEAIS